MTELPEKELKQVSAPPIQNPQRELNQPEIPEVIATPKDVIEPSPLKHALHLFQQLRKQGLFVTLIEAYDQILRRVTGAPTERFSRVTDQIHVGGQFTEAGWRTLSQRGVTAGVSMRGEFDTREAGFAPPKYLYLPTVDNHAPTLEALQQGVEFITAEVERGGQVYIHCWEGVGRAPTMTAAYLVSTGMTPAEAWGTIKAARPFIRPSVVQLQQIDIYAAKMQGITEQPPLSEKLPSVPDGTIQQAVEEQK
ncbi:MAG: dual specificity protein phosphatase family protein [Anaerolinea sp.]|nr:dual specificity protein phosphatase family protein [Anaerolinea sp.]